MNAEVKLESVLNDRVRTVLRNMADASHSMTVQQERKNLKQLFSFQYYSVFVFFFNQAKSSLDYSRSIITDIGI